MSAFKYFTKIDIVQREACEGQLKPGGLLSECSVRDPEQRRLFEVEARVPLVCASTDNGRPFTGSTRLIWTVVD